MDYIHSCGIIHRDLKPANILVGTNFSIAVIDFGISRVCLTKRPMTMNIGTPGMSICTNMEHTNWTKEEAWIAPEVFSGNGVYTSAVDGKRMKREIWRGKANSWVVYSFGMILWEFLTEEKPYESLKISSFDIPMRVVEGIRPLIPER